MNNIFFFGQNKKIGSVPVLIYKVDMRSRELTMDIGTDYSGIYNFDVDWGDGTFSKGITTGDDPKCVHEYSTSGIYDIKIYGLCSAVYPTIRSRSHLIEIGGTGENISNIEQSESNKLTTIQSGFLSKYKGTSISTLFSGCPLLVDIPKDFLINNTTIQNAYGSFRECTSLKRIPDGFLSSAPLQNIAEVFKGCSSLEYIPSNFTEASTTLQSCNSAFKDCTNLMFSPDLTSKIVTNHADTYTNCTSLPPRPYYPIDWGGLGQAEPPILELRIAVPSDSFDVLLPITSTGTYNFIVEWGDGQSNTITQYSDPNKTHTYASSGNYEISIRGQLTHYNTDRGINEIITEVGGTGKTIEEIKLAVYFTKTSQLTKLRDNFLIMAYDLKNADNMLSYCKQLTTLPDEFLSNAINLESATYLLSGKPLTAIPNKFLHNCTKLKNVTGLCSSLSELTYIPDDFLINAINLETAAYIFGRCEKITNIPDYFLSNSSKLIDASSMFTQTSITEIPVGLLENNLLVEKVSQLISYTKIKHVPATFLNKNKKITDANYMLQNNKLMTSVEEGFLANQKNLTIRSLFANSDNLESAPDYRPRAADFTNHRSCYQNCTKLPFFSTLPYDWKN